MSCDVNCEKLCIVGVVKQISTYDPFSVYAPPFSVIVENKNKIKFDCKAVIQNKDRCEYFVFCKDCNNGNCEEVLIRSEAEETLNGKGIYMFNLLLNAYNNKDIVKIVYYKKWKNIEEVSIYKDKEDGI